MSSKSKTRIVLAIQLIGPIVAILIAVSIQHWRAL
jgi:hypothetical protein